MRVVPAKTARNKQRDWALSKAEELLKKDKPGQKVEAERGSTRAVKVNDTVAFKQEKEDEKGSFKNGFLHLTLP